jgi:tetratricopeptide (TPR) repeat protein
VGLSAFYDLPIVTTAKSVDFLLPAGLLAAFVAATFICFRYLRDPVLPTMMAWIFAPIVLVSNIGNFQPDDFLHDEYLYLPCVGLVILFLGSQPLNALLGKPIRRSFKAIATADVAFIVAALVAVTIYQARPWQSDLTLYSRAVEIAPKNTMARNGLAGQYAKGGRLEEASDILGSVVEERPTFWLANYNLGYVDYRMRRLDLAEQFLHRAIAINPADADEYMYLGLTYFQKGDLAEGAQQVRQAIARNPSGTGYHVVLGEILLQQGNLSGAKSEFQTELAYHPQSASAQDELSEMEQQQKK